MPAGPPLSIVVIPLIGNDALANCLDRLPLTAMECIVVLREAMGAVTDWEQRYPSVTFLGAAHEPVPVRRQCGLRFATGEVVGLIEDTSWPDEGWCAAALSAFADAQTAALLTRGLVVPCVQLQTPFYEDRPAFLQIFARYFREARPQNDIDKGDFFAFLAAIERIYAIDRKTEIANGAAFRRVSDFGIAR